MSYRFDDTVILSTLSRPSGCYVLAYSEDCSRQRGAGYSIRHYEDQQAVDAYTDHETYSIDFDSHQEGLAAIEESFEEHDDEEALVNWIKLLIG